ncbi:hypothetical protein BCD67_00465 [Oscillatoriales cyanobacterium USR001]|nr:hypothetical protein BCD67_00465 [Oscillatoriales cyanobacterium USR001]
MKIAKIYSNENFPIDIVNKLRYLGHDVLTSYQAGQANQGIPDDDVLKFAHQQDRVVITLNREDFIMLHRNGKEHSGIIICKDDRDYDAQSSKVHELILDVTELKSRLFRVKKQNVKGGKTQKFIYEELTNA